MTSFVARRGNYLLHLILLASACSLSFAVVILISLLFLLGLLILNCVVMNAVRISFLFPFYRYYFSRLLNFFIIINVLITPPKHIINILNILKKKLNCLVSLETKLNTGIYHFKFNTKLYTLTSNTTVKFNYAFVTALKFNNFCYQNNTIKVRNNHSICGNINFIAKAGECK